MANPYAGEVALVIDGQRHVLKLTLGALAELESALGADSLVALVERFEISQSVYRTDPWAEHAREKADTYQPLADLTMEAAE